MRNQPLLSLIFLFIFFFLLPHFSLSSSSSPPAASPPPPHRLRRVLLGVLLGALTGLSFSLLLLFFARFCILYACYSPLLVGPVVFSPAISPKALQLSLSNPSGLTPIPRSKLYYRITLEDGVSLAVKRLERTAERRRLQRRLSKLASVGTHGNVMGIRAFLIGPEVAYVAYDYMAGTSLEEAMERGVEMGWEVRYGIAVGVAKGLRFLHFESCPRVVHGGVKPGNVLLDEEFQPRLADCGLAGLFSPEGGSVGCYTPPECLQSSSGCTDKSDVFGFGLVLAALVTGKDPRTTEYGGFGKWLCHLQQSGDLKDALHQVVDIEEDEMLMALRVAIVCLNESPADRPSSDELVAMLSQIHSF